MSAARDAVDAELMGRFIPAVGQHVAYLLDELEADAFRRGWEAREAEPQPEHLTTVWDDMGGRQRIYPPGQDHPLNDDPCRDVFRVHDHHPAPAWNHRNPQPRMRRPDPQPPVFDLLDTRSDRPKPGLWLRFVRWMG